jgi:hypothetical protein
MSARPSVAKLGAASQATRAIAQNWRLWATLPADVEALVIKRVVGRRTVISSVARPVFPAGVCRRCGCTESDPCVRASTHLGPVACAWSSPKQDRCTFCPTRPEQSRRRRGPR